MFKTLALTTCTLLLLTTGCKKKDEAKTADPTTEAKPGEAKPTEAKPTEMKPATGATFANAAEYEAKAMEAMDKMTAVFVADGTDCDKLAADMSAFLDANKDTFAAAKAFEAANPDAKKAFDAKSAEKGKEFMAKAGPAMEKCKDNKALGAAMTKLAE